MFFLKRWRLSKNVGTKMSKNNSGYSSGEVRNMSNRTYDFSGDAEKLDISTQGKHASNFHKFEISSPNVTDLAGSSELSVVTWNLLAPPYDTRYERSNRHLRSNWENRVLKQVQHLGELNHQPDVVFLQEFWCSNPEYMQIWKDFCKEHGYNMFVGQRTGNKEDAVCTLLRENKFKLDQVDIFSYQDWGHRVCLAIEAQYLNMEQVPKAVTLLNTHLTFPHSNEHDPIMRAHQGKKLEKVISEYKNKDRSIILGGDMNGDIDDEALSPIFRVVEPWSKEKSWQSHKDHHGKLIGCDFIAQSGCGFNQQKLYGNLEESDYMSDHLLLFCKLGLEK